MHTTQLLVLLGGAKLGVELVLREAGVMLQIQRQIAFLVVGGSFRTDLARSYVGHVKNDRDRLEPNRTIQIRSTPAF